MFISACILIILPARQSQARTEIELSGRWNYCFLQSERDYPPSAAAEWKAIALPSRDLFERIAKKNNVTKGYLLFRKTITLPSVPADRLVFQAGEIMNTDAVLVNGKQIGRTGIFPPEFKSGWSRFRNYRVPADVLVAGANTIDIVVYFDAELWVISPVRFMDETRGNPESMIRNLIQVDLIHAFCILLLVFSILFISIYFMRKTEVVYFYYAAATFFLADMTILQFVENLYTYIPLSSNTIYKICGLGPMFFPPFMAFFFRSYLGLHVSGKRIAAYLLLPCVIALLMLASQDRYYIIFWRNVFLLLIPLYIAEIVITSVRQILAGNRRGLLLFVVLLPVFFFGIYDILVFSLYLFEGSVPLYPMGITFMLVLSGVQLVKRFIYNLETSERLNLLLREKIDEGKRLASLEKELAIARRIQLANVPRSLPELGGFDIGVKYIPAENISGDFYNFHAVGQNTLGVLIADISGHGIPASLIASMLKILFSTLAPVCSEPAMFVKGLNAYLYDKMEGNFLTAAYCYIRAADGKALYARAGHEPLLHISRAGGGAALREYAPRGRLIGLSADMDFELLEFDVALGDRLVLYTDGIIEAFNESREMLGRERFQKLVMESRDLSAEASIEAIHRAVREWISSTPLVDDFTLVIIDIT